MVQPLINKQIPADFLTANHYVFGQVTVSNTGLMGILSDVHTSHIEVNDASIARIVKPDKVINYAASMSVMKRQIVAVCVNKREYIGSATMMRAGYNRLIPYPVQITSPVYELHGSLEYAGRLEFSALMNDGSNPFLALYDATLVAALFPALHMERPAIIFNRNFIDTMVILKRSPQEISGGVIPGA